MPVVLFLLFCALTSPVGGEESTVYKRVRPDGTVEFSDEPTPDSEAIQVPNLSTFPFRPIPPAAKPVPQPAAPAAFRYQTLQVTEPAPEATVFFNEEGMPVSVSVTPPLQTGHTVKLYLDGQEVAQGAATRFVLQNVYRGTHSLTAVVEDAKGEILVRSEPSTFNFIQHTIRP